MAPRVPLVALLVCAICASVASPLAPTTVAAAQTSTSASIAPSLSPDRPHAHATLTLTIRYAGGELGVPSPLRRAVMDFPAGLNFEIPVLRSCDATVLLTRGVRGCPALSEIGHGQALVEGNLGALPTFEEVKLWAFLGPLRNLQPTFEILATGHTPLAVQMVLTATALPARAPYGEALAMTVPAVPTVPGEPDASVISFSLTIGTGGRRGRHAATVEVPSNCPPGGLPFAAAFTYADGSSGSALATVPCPL